MRNANPKLYEATVNKLKFWRQTEKQIQSIITSGEIIESFDIYGNNNFNYLSTIEVDSLGNKFNGIYEWDDFGFALKTFNPIR